MPKMPKRAQRPKHDLRIDLGFLQHPKTKRLRRLLGADGVLALEALWIFAAINHPTGVLPLDALGIADAADWQGDPEEFVDVLVNGTRLKPDGAGFLEIVEGGYYLHDWEEHQPYLATAPERSAQARHAAEAKWRKRRGQDANRDIEHQISNAESVDGDATSTQPHTNGNAPYPYPYPDQKPSSPVSPSPEGASAGLAPGDEADPDPAFAAVQNAYLGAVGRFACSPNDLVDISAGVKEFGEDIPALCQAVREIVAEHVHTHGKPPWGFRYVLTVLRNRAEAANSRASPPPPPLQRDDTSELFARARGGT